MVWQSMEGGKCSSAEVKPYNIEGEGEEGSESVANVGQGMRFAATSPDSNSKVSSSLALMRSSRRKVGWKRRATKQTKEGTKQET